MNFALNRAGGKRGRRCEGIGWQEYGGLGDCEVGTAPRAVLLTGRDATQSRPLTRARWGRKGSGTLPSPDEQRSRRSRAPNPVHRVGLALRANLVRLSIPLGQHAVLTLPRGREKTRRSRNPTSPPLFFRTSWPRRRRLNGVGRHSPRPRVGRFRPRCFPGASSGPLSHPRRSVPSHARLRRSED